jgi:hypothetical protein
MKVIKVANTRGIADIKARNNGMQVIFFRSEAEPYVGSYFKFSKNKDGAKHVRRKP